MDLEFDALVTGAIFVAIIVVGAGAMLFSEMMASETVLMMVLPSMVVFGLICLGLGVLHGQYRASA